MPGLLERNNQFAMGEEEIAAENRQQLLDVLIRLLTDTDLEVGVVLSLWFVSFDDPLPYPGPEGGAEHNCSVHEQ